MQYLKQLHFFLFFLFFLNFYRNILFHIQFDLIYYHATKKAICIELDAANKSSAGVTVGVAVEDTGSLGSAQTSVSITSAANGTFTKSSHGLNVNDRVVLYLIIMAKFQIIVQFYNKYLLNEN